MSKPSILSVFLILTIASTAMPDDEKQQIVDQQLRYLRHLERAEAHLQSSNPAAALNELKQALSYEVLDSHIPFMELKTKAATAHYLRACAFAAQHSNSEALASLREAAANEYRNTALVKSDPRLAGLRELAEFKEILSLFPALQPTDKFAGKTVADRDFGIAMQMARKGNFPKLGEVAPDFELSLLGKKQQALKLSSFRGKQPVVLVFGSFT